ncbi:MAG: hypothetical protein AB1566_07945 [Chloroflexota bacterium]
MSEELYAQLFEGTKRVAITIEILEETYQEAERLIQENGWGEEGLRIIFAHGLGYLKGQEIGKGLATSDTDILLKRFMDVDSMYAVMKFRAFTLAQDNQILGFNVSGLRGQVDLSHAVLAKQREEIATLKAEYERLTRLLAESEGDKEPISPSAESAGNPTPGRLSRLREAIGRRVV